MNREEIITKNFDDVNKSLFSVCNKVGRNLSDIHFVAVTKYAKDSDVLFALKQNLITQIGESRLQQAVKRWSDPIFSKFNVVKHFIGHVQTNKASKIAQFFDFVDSVDSLKVAEALNHAVPLGKKLKVLVQIKLTDRETQGGISLEEASELVNQIRALNSLKVCGYMAIAPQHASELELRQLFKKVADIFEKDFLVTQERYLSLGMSNDFAIAVEEGSTLPRIGTNLFSKNLEDI